MLLLQLIFQNVHQNPSRLRRGVGREDGTCMGGGHRVGRSDWGRAEGAGEEVISDLIRCHSYSA